MRRSLVIALALVAVVVAGLLFVGVPGHPPAARAAEPTPLEIAVQDLMTRLMKNKKGLQPGITYAQALKETGGASHINYSHMVPLAKTPYAPAGEWHGVVDLFVNPDEPREELDSFNIALLCGEYDKSQMARWLLKTVGPKLGLALEPDEEEKNLYWDPDPKVRDIWISLGDGLIQFHCSTLE